MASSFISQVPSIIQLIEKLEPQSVLDIGKGFGKYGFLIHEYIGINRQQKIDSSKSLKELSSISIDAVEIDPDLMLPHLEHLYRNVHFGDVLDLYATLPSYDIIMMVDIIEHISKATTLPMLKYFLAKGSKIIISTPIEFFEQHLYESVFENHVSHWTKRDFETLGFVDVQYFDAGAIYLLSEDKIDVRGFGNSWLKKLRRLGRFTRNEI